MSCMGEGENCVPFRDYPKTNNETQQLKGCFMKCLVGMALAVFACLLVVPLSVVLLLDLYAYFLNM